MSETEQKYLKIIRWSIFLCAFTPLIFYGKFLSIFHFPKLIVFRSIVEIMLIFYILLIIGNKKYRPNFKNPVLIAVTVFTGLYIITSITGINFYRSFWGTLERMGGVFSFVHYWVFFVILISIFKDKKDWLKLLKFCIIAGFLSILFAYGQQFDLGEFFVGWQHGRIFGTTGNAALFAGYLIFILFFSIYFISKKETSKGERFFYGLVLVLGIPALFLTVVRGSILSFLGALLLLGVFIIFISKKKQFELGALSILILLLILVGIFWACKDQSWVQKNSYLQRITNISLDVRTVQT
ncbi:MAG: hypothetical protein ACOC80_07360, partial [Petrotogales bacterium]